MIEFLNSNSSAVFSVITLSLTLFIPYLTKRLELKHESRIEKFKSNKTTYSNLIFFFGTFYNLLNDLYEIVRKNDEGSFHNNYDRIMNELLEYHQKSKNLFNTSISIDYKLIEPISTCLKNQSGTLEILQRLGKDNVSRIVAPMLNALELYQANYFLVRKLMLKY